MYRYTPKRERAQRAHAKQQEKKLRLGYSNNNARAARDNLESSKHKMINNLKEENDRLNEAEKKSVVWMVNSRSILRRRCWHVAFYPCVPSLRLAFAVPRRVEHLQVDGGAVHRGHLLRGLRFVLVVLLAVRHARGEGVPQPLGDRSQDSGPGDTVAARRRGARSTWKPRPGRD